MLLDASGYRQYTPQECALIEHAAQGMAEDLEPCEDELLTGIEEFDRMERDERLVALHILCTRAASEDCPEKRELWLDATLMAVLEILHSEMESLFWLLEKQPSTRNYAELAELNELLLRSYHSFHWDLQQTLNMEPDERSELDEILLEMCGKPMKIPNASQEVLTAILEEYRDSLFLDWDFFAPAGLMDQSPEGFAAHSEMMGIAPEYRTDIAPSCPPQAVREARKYFSLPSA